MKWLIPINNISCNLIASVNAPSPITLMIVAEDANKRNTYYISRKCEIAGKDTYEIKLPQAPDMLSLSIYNLATGNSQRDNSFTVSLKATTLKTYPLWYDSNLQEFLPFAQWFVENASILSANVTDKNGNVRPSVYKSSTGKFTIRYYDKLTDNQGRPVLTPARIGHISGAIELSKSDFLGYSIPVRLAVLLHEYCHKYVNPLAGKEIGDEVSADLNACNIYLSLNYPEVELRYAFLKIFSLVNNNSNAHRYKMIDKFINEFKAGKLSPKKAA